MIKIGKPYTAAQLKEIFGDDYFEKRIKVRVFPEKPRIINFDDFDDHTKQVYLKIRDEVIRCNRSYQNPKVYATGSRISGTWRTPEEAEKIAEELGTKPKYSDYDYWTDAPVKPPIQRLCDITGVKIDCVKAGLLLKIPDNV